MEEAGVEVAPWDELRVDDDLVVGTVPLDSVEALQVLEPFGVVLLDLALVLLNRSSLKKGMVVLASPQKALASS